jgi:8-oxo-dGTP pyrophosphatase MutT (NUDIX family)
MILEKLREVLKGITNIIGLETKYTQASVLIPFVLKDNVWHILYQVRSDNIRQGGEIGFPGGLMEENDMNPSDTAIRETCEELGVDPGQIQLLGGLGTLITNVNLALHAWIGVLNIKDLDDLNCNEEVKEVFMVPVEDLLNQEPVKHYIRMSAEPHYIDEEGQEVVLLPSKQLHLPEKYQQTWYVGKRPIYFYHYKGYQIWGMTGELTFELMELLRLSHYQ